MMGKARSTRPRTRRRSRRSSNRVSPPPNWMPPAPKPARRDAPRLEHGLAATRLHMLSLLATGIADSRAGAREAAMAAAESMAKLMLTMLNLCLPALCKHHAAAELSALAKTHPAGIDRRAENRRPGQSADGAGDGGRSGRIGLRIGRTNSPITNRRSRAGRRQDQLGRWLRDPRRRQCTADGRRRTGLYGPAATGDDRCLTQWT